MVAWALAFPFLLLWLFLFWYGVFILASKKKLSKVKLPIERLTVTFFFSYLWLVFLTVFAFKFSFFLDFHLGKLSKTYLYKYFVLQKNHGLPDLIFFFIASFVLSTLEVRLGKLLGWKFLAGGLVVAVIGWTLILFL